MPALRRTYCINFFLSKRTLESEYRYKRYKNKHTSILRKAEKAYYSEELRKVMGNIKNICDVLKKATNRLRKENINCTSFEHNNSSICDPTEISEKRENIDTNRYKNKRDAQKHH